MSFVSLLPAELRKTRRSGILAVLLLAAGLLWLPSAVNARLNFQMQAEGISPEHSYFVQGFLALAWLLYPGCMAVVTVLLDQTERSGGCLRKMLSLPVSPARLCLAKFAALLCFSAVLILLSVGGYYLSGAAASRREGYDFLLSLGFVLPKAAAVWAASLPMLAFFWLLAVSLPTPGLAAGLMLASAVPSVLVMNTCFWLLYPPDYAFYVVTALYGGLAEGMDTWTVSLFPWLPVAALLGAGCLGAACLRFGRAERR